MSQGRDNSLSVVIQGQKEALELVLRGAPMAESLTVLTRTIENLSGGEVQSSILLIDQSGRHLNVVAAPSLPAAYNHAINGVEIGPQVGSCGTAAYSGQTTVVSDIASDQRWQDFRATALAFGLRSCWSTPIISSQGKILGTFAIYGQEAREPSPMELEVVELMTSTAALIIERAEKEIEQKKIDEDLREAKRAADLASEAKTAFLANVSHEIRTPLGAILGFADLLLLSPEVTADQQEFAEIIKRNSQLLSMLIDDILDLSKVEAGKLEIEYNFLQLQTFLEDVQAALSFYADEKGIELRISTLGTIPDFIVTDEFRLKQILNNIIGNAIKFTDQGYVNVTVQLSNGPYEKRSLRFEVADTGHGISEDQAKRLFEPFTQADSSTSRRFGGTGLGLVLSRKLARLLGGDVCLLRSEPNNGSCFGITIDPGEPVSPGICEEKQGRTTCEDHVLSGLRVLVADDLPDNRILLSRILEGVGAQVAMVENGEQAVASALASDWDVILMDVRMPVLDGHAATTELRSMGYQGPILALTAHTFSDLQKNCLAIGYDDYFCKPIDRIKLISALENYLQH